MPVWLMGKWQAFCRTINSFKKTDCKRWGELTWMRYEDIRQEGRRSVIMGQKEVTLVH